MPIGVRAYRQQERVCTGSRLPDGNLPGREQSKEIAEVGCGLRNKNLHSAFRTLHSGNYKDLKPFAAEGAENAEKIKTYRNQTYVGGKARPATMLLKAAEGLLNVWWCSKQSRSAGVYLAWRAFAGATAGP